MKRHYGEGTWIAVPLKTGGFALGLIARASNRGAVLCYFFGPRRQALPQLSEAKALRPDDAVKVVRVGDLHLLDGKWSVLGTLASWDRSLWSMPPFARRDSLSKRAWRVEHSEDDLLTVVSEVSEPYESQLETDGVYGAQAAEALLDYIL